ncbi:MAG TPA: TIGR01777 family oxidoreductase [Verrucomicrobiales bacterium]|nr:TIGR01777 family oxidoreductase [Verrucomicrobiales bacterium]
MTTVTTDPVSPESSACPVSPGQIAQPRRIILAGGSGFLGTDLARALQARGDQPIVLSRRPAQDSPWPQVEWDGTALGAWCAQLDGAAALVNLTGRNVNCRPTRANREEILRSRVASVRVLGEALRAIAQPPPVWVQASSLAIHGNAQDTLCDEDSGFSGAWPATVCTAWESTFQEAVLPAQRAVVLRIGFVLAREGGALPMLERLTRWGLGGSIGSGRQGISWLHAEDMVRLFLAVIDNPRFTGVLDATAPGPRSNRDLMRALRRAMGRPWSPPAPVWAVHMGAWMLGSDPHIALTGRYCRSRRLPELGFDFRFPDLESALADLYANSPSKPTAALNPTDAS